MITKRLLIAAALAAILVSASIRSSAITTEDAKEAETWSAPVNGLQARIVLAEKPNELVEHWIVPYLELRNVRDLAHPLEVRCDAEHVQFELLDAAGEEALTRRSRERSGITPDLGRVILPMDSSIHICMDCRNWGVNTTLAMISTDSGAWALDESERGKVFLKATIVGEPVEGDRYKTWHGRIETLPVKVDWKH